MLLFFSLACPSPSADESGAAGVETPTWHADVAPVVMQSCAGCHTAGAIGPFPLDSYEAAAPMAAAIAGAVESGSMPPWGAESTDECQPRFAWKDDPSLSDEEKDMLRRWADAGAPEGDPASAAAVPDPISLTLEDANQRLSPEVGFAASGNRDQYTCFVMDPGLSTTRWLTGVQVEAGNEEVVHHALIFADESGDAASRANADGFYACPGNEGLGGQLVGAWAPGAVPTETPEGAGIEVAAGSAIVMQIHYHPRGEVAATDITSVDLRWVDEAPEHPAVLTLVGNADDEASGLLPGPNDDDGVEFRIPAGAKDHTEEMAFPIDSGRRTYQVYMAGTHMHYVGTDMRVWVDHHKPEGDEPASECLVQTPNWDFDWQRGYAYDAPLADVPQVRNRDTLRMVCRYDNTLENPGVQRALSDAGETEPQDVYLGETTLDEMCLAVLGIVYE
jgi:hypothetical protein